MQPNNEQEQLSKLIALIQEAIQQDTLLRQTHQMGEKFGFVQERLQSLLVNIEKETTSTEKKTKVAQVLTVQEDEIFVYIHLYNAQGLNFRTWQSMITPKAFFDFSVNRPLYQEQKYIDAFIHSKTNKAQHAYLTVIMKKEQLLPSPNSEEGGYKDSLGNSLIKVKEGSLRHERMFSFTHNEQVYHTNEAGELIKKMNEPTAVK